MAYDKIIVIDRRLDHCLDYALNEEKTALSRALDYGMEPTKTRHLVTGVNCCPETACSEMQATKRRWDKRGGIQGYHIIHSYAPGEVTPEKAHDAGVEFARRLLGDRYEAVVSTHTDQEHLHSGPMTFNMKMNPPCGTAIPTALEAISRCSHTTAIRTLRRRQSPIGGIRPGISRP